MLVARLTTPTRLTALLFVALLPLAGPALAPAHADGPVPTVLFVHFGGDGDHAGQSIDVIADVRPADGGPAYPRGSVVFSVGDGTPVPVDPTYLSAKTTVTIPSNDPFTVTATFTGTDGWGDSTASGTFTPLTRRVFDPEPTVARIGAGSLRLTLTFATYLRNTIGGPMPGRQIAFTLLNPPPTFNEPGGYSIPVCTATTDANGLASCKGSAALASIVSILTNGGYATYVNGPFTGSEFVHLPVIVAGGP